MKLLEDSIAPLYQQVMEDIKTSIESGKFKQDEKIPSEKELSEEYSVSRITIRRAVEELCDEGYLLKQHGKGTFVSRPKLNRKVTQSNFVESFTETCKSNGMKASGKVIRKQIVPIRQDEQAFFSLPENSNLIYISRIRCADGQPIMMENIFLPYEGNEYLLAADLDKLSLFSLIEQHTGLRPTNTSQRTIEVLRAPADVAELLDVPVGEPMFYINVYFQNDNKQPIYIGRQYMVGSRYIYSL